MMCARPGGGGGGVGENNPGVSPKGYIPIKAEYDYQSLFGKAAIGHWTGLDRSAEIEPENGHENFLIVSSSIAPLKILRQLKVLAFLSGHAK